MVTSKLSNSASGTQLPSSVKAPTNMKMQAQDFIQMMITQLQNQDPLQPTGSDQLLSQMSQIGQMQSASSLQDTLQGLAQQNQIGAASSLIGKTVQGVDANQNPLSGLVTSVKVASTGVSLELDNGNSLDLANVTNISPGTTTPTTHA